MPLDAVTENQLYLCKGKAYEFQTWYLVPHLRLITVCHTVCYYINY